MKNIYVLFVVLAGLTLAPACKKEKKEHIRTSKIQMDDGYGAAMAVGARDMILAPRISHEELLAAIDSNSYNRVYDLLDGQPLYIVLPLVNFRDANRQTPLMRACMVGNLEIVNYLLGIREIDIHVADNMGRTALGWAINGHHHDIERALRAAGAR